MWPLLLLACDAPPIPASRPLGVTPAPADTADTGVELDDLGLVWVEDGHPTRARLRWSPRPGELVLTVDDGVTTWERRSDATAGEWQLVGLPAGAALRWLATAPGAAASGTYAVPPPPADLAPLVASPADPASELTDSWVLTTLFDFPEGSPSYALAVDAWGRLRWWRAAPPGHRILRAYVADDGAAVVWASNTTDHTVDDGRIVREPIDGGPLIETVAPNLHHDFVEDPPGGYAYIGWVFDPVADLGAGPEPIATDAIRRVAEGGTGAFEQVFDFFSDWPDPPSKPCSHARFGNFVPGWTEWTHTNSIVRATDGDGWWILPRYLDQIARVRADGTLVGVLGGVGAATPTWSFTGGPYSLPFAHGHFSAALDDHTVLVFDNGDHLHPADGSRVVELRVDPVAGTVDEVWAAPEPEGRFLAFLGDAKRLPGGNTLIVNANHGIYEVDPAGEVLFSALQVAPTNMGRAQVITPW